MVINEALKTIIRDICDFRLTTAMGHLENYIYTFSLPQFSDQLAELRKDYQLMNDYWQRGYKDPQREELFYQLLQRMYGLTVNVYIRFYISNSTYVNTAFRHSRTDNADQSVAAIRKRMEDFVSETAILQFEPESTRRNKRKLINEKHLLFMTALFDYIWTSRLWNDNVTEAFQEMLLSPTIDSSDQQLLTSAITLSTLNFFDYNKFRLLVNIYKQSANEHVRQRALVGWVLCLNSDIARIYPETLQLINSVTISNTYLEELAELQIQMIYCIKADSDNRIIQNEIMPNLMHSGFTLDSNGNVTEALDDSIEDMLHPEQSELRMEKLEASIQRMKDMQNQGSDVYFGGFSQMKKFPFFHTAANWFLPFSMHHPAVEDIITNIRGKNILKRILNISPFCNSDKYSLTLAFHASVSRLPDSILQMMDNSEAILPGSSTSNEEMNTPAFIRRNYLQDLYRFFRVFSHRSDFFNPFETTLQPRYLFFANPLFQKTPLEKLFPQIITFLLKQKAYDAAAKVLQNVTEENRDEQFYLLNATLLMRTHNKQNAGLTALECYRQLLQANPNNQQAWIGYARTSFEEGDYQTALNYYRKLMDLSPDNSSYQLYEAACLSCLHKYDESLKILYKLNYNQPDNKYVNSIFAWTLTCSGKYQQALNIFESLLATEAHDANDIVNYAYCLWFSGSIAEAGAAFQRYANIEGVNFKPSTEFLKKESDFLAAHGITPVEIQLMLNLIDMKK